MKNFNVLWAMFGGVILLQVVLGVVTYFELPGWPERSAFGSMFGGVNTLFSGLAFCGVIYAILLQGKELTLQRDELKLQREELALTREELKRSADAQQEQSAVQLDAAVINALSSKLTMYSTLLANSRAVPDQSHDDTCDGLNITLKDLNRLIDKNSRNR
ncbi:hypothetical protein [Vibrio vulnificus]|uniref:hypothetical protein n=1 Tax=Vibrio vulnificus TaxID=672 RepID=UPI0024DF852E|nr:hypothetical protein [Vibrio vulnificus]ELP6759561.1 hypothetical protein [Vibrio vulnificus]MDK2622585.1 hypothetical protein [Vibrio vulnificus]HDY7708646.1 hypothetical protein [Vibrio vulnificus]